MAVVDAHDMLVNKVTISVCGALLVLFCGIGGTAHFGFDDAGRAQTNDDAAVLLEHPVDQVVVIADHGSDSNDEISARATVTDVRFKMSPGWVARITLKDTEHVSDHSWAAGGIGVERILVGRLSRTIFSRQEGLVEA